MEEVKEQPAYTIQKVKVKNNRLMAEYTEKYLDANYKNEVTKASEQFVHPDLLYALSRLKPFLISICEMDTESTKKIDVSDPTDEDLNETLKNIVITGYSKGGTDETEGVCIIAQKLLRSGKIMNITTPFVTFSNEDGNGYEYANELEQAISRCDYEVDAYLFSQKFGIKQEQFDFDEPEESDIENIDEDKPKKRGRKKKNEKVPPIDVFA